LSPNLSGLSFFSYDTIGGASSLGLIATLGGITGCSGAPSVLSLACNPAGDNPASTRADMVLVTQGIAFSTTPDLTTVTLVSSVNTGVPEPSTWATMLLGFVGLGFARRRQRRVGRAASLA
jgi:hypothetical protein